MIASHCMGSIWLEGIHLCPGMRPTSHLPRHSSRRRSKSPSTTADDEIFRPTASILTLPSRNLDTRQPGFWCWMKPGPTCGESMAVLHQIFLPCWITFIVVVFIAFQAVVTADQWNMNHAVLVCHDHISLHMNQVMDSSWAGRIWCRMWQTHSGWIMLCDSLPVACKCPDLHVYCTSSY